MKKFSKEQLDKIINNSFKAGTQNNLYYLSEETFRQMKKDKRFVQTYKVRTDIANEMLNLIDKSVWHNKNAKVLQLAGMSDDFFSLMFSRFYFGLASEIPDRYERAQYILDNNIYILCLDLVNQLYTQTECYCEPVSDSNIFKFGTYKIENNRLIEVSCNNVLGNINLYQMKLSLLDGGLKVEDMKFDAVVGNPPYNDDIYIDFVNLGFELLKDTGIEVMITPAKWQAKGGQKNEAFRKNIVPHMSKIVYYPNPLDVFPDTPMCGDAITYYTIGKTVHSDKYINNKLEEHWETRYGLDNTCINIVKKIHGRRIVESKDVSITPVKSYFTSRNFGDVSEDTSSRYYMRSSARCIKVPESAFNNKKDMDKHKVYIGHYITSNPVLHLVEPFVADVREDCLLGFGSKEKCESIISYYKCKLIWFLVFMTNCGNASKEAFINVPDPGAFDHIFTDEELYKKYNLTEEEISIIESVIKERK